MGGPLSLTSPMSSKYRWGPWGPKRTQSQTQPARLIKLLLCPGYSGRASSYFLQGRASFKEKLALESELKGSITFSTAC